MMTGGSAAGFLRPFPPIEPSFAVLSLRFPAIFTLPANLK
ncbi:hypothetical protein D083_4443 [Dickeya solani RNS 08.23.3.1.A]|nr:hypothetical protein D083_4443 [Dickeya solani RNS 08.23.3.1.A]